MLLEEKALILTLLTSAERRLGSVLEMIEKEQNCIKVLYQLQLVQATMQNCGHLLVQYRLQQTLETVCYDDCPENRSKELENLADLFSYYQEFS